MSENQCTHGQHHSYCTECLDGPPRGPISEAAGVAVKAALELAPIVAAARPGDSGRRGLEIEFESVDAAEYARVEINRALAATEWSDEVSSWVWYAGSSSGSALTAAGQANGYEIRLQPWTAT